MTEKKEGSALVNAAQKIQDMYFVRGAIIDVGTWEETKTILANLVASEIEAARQEGREKERSGMRDLVARLYCAAGCPCCRDDKEWDAAGDALGERLGIPKFGDASGYDFYSVRDAARRGSSE